MSRENEVYGAFEFRSENPEFFGLGTLAYKPISDMRAKARAAGLSESEVEKISTCPLVKLLVNQS